MKQACQMCGFVGERELRDYSEGGTFYNQSEQIRRYKIFHCGNCGLFSWEKRSILRTSWTRQEYQDANGWGEPERDPDYKKWLADKENEFGFEIEKLCINDGKGRRGMSFCVIHRGGLNES